MSFSNTRSRWIKSLCLSLIALMILVFGVLLGRKSIESKVADSSKPSYISVNDAYSSTFKADISLVNDSVQYVGDDINQDANNNCSLLESVRKEAAQMRVFPIDLIIDDNQLDEEYAQNEGMLGISFFYNRPSPVPDDEDSPSKEKKDSNGHDKRYRYYPNFAQLCVDALTEDYCFTSDRIDLIHLSKYVDKRYDITYDNYKPYYRFYNSAFNASCDEIKECFASFETMNSKEKALALTALYIFEQRNRTRKSIINDVNNIKAWKYPENQNGSDPFSDEEWASLLNYMYENRISEEIAFDSVPNEELVEEWERSLRSHALIFQRDLHDKNPFFQTETLTSYWYSLCRLAPIDFIYALLLVETDETFLNMKKPYPQRDPHLYFPFGKKKDGSRAPNIFYMSTDFIQKYNLRCDALLFYTKVMPLDFVRVGGEEWDERLPANESITLMREYLKTQYSFSRRYTRMPLSGMNGYIDTINNVAVYERSYGNHMNGLVNANTSIEPKTLGYIANTLLHSRSLFEDDKR